MPCNHKFLEDLRLEKLDFQPTTLIVGTFNPAWPESNQAEWFYGRTHDIHGNINNNFWDVLPRLYGEKTLLNAGTAEWKEFCKKYKIAITDLISCIGDANRPLHDAAMGGYSDEKIANDFHDHTFVNIVALLENYPGVKHVYLTRGAAPTFWTRLWRPVRNYCALNGLHHDNLLTPSGYAFYQHGRYNKANLQQQILNLNDFILRSWQQKWHQIND